MSTPDPARKAPARLDQLAYGLVILVIALAFQGSRGLFEPDEGRYAAAALEMLRSGDWLLPRLQGLVYLDKPPAIYWSVAAGFELLGVNEWGARVGLALALAATALVVAAWSGSAWGKQVGRLSGAAYVTTLLPLAAANTVTPDTLLALWTTAGAFCYWSWRGSRSPAERWRWALLLGAATGLALLSKGTAALVFLAPVVLHAVWESGPKRLISRPELWAAALLGAAIGLSWYVGVSRNVPGSAQYFFDNQVAGRLWKSTYGRNPEWWAPIRIYGPILVFGSLPWSLAWWGAWRSGERRQRLGDWWRDPLNRYLILSTLVPLALFSLAKSRLHLYILPIFPYLTMLTISQACRGARSAWSRRVVMAAVGMILIKGLGGVVPIRNDARALAAALRQAGVRTEECVDALETKVYGLSVYGFSRTSWHTMWPETYPYFEAPRLMMSDLPALLDRCGGRIRFLVETKKTPAAQNLFASTQLTCGDEPVSAKHTLFTCAASALPRAGAGS